MRKLIAKCPILYHSHTYQEGEVLPTDNLDNIKLWIKKDVAMWEKEGKERHESIENDVLESSEGEKLEEKDSNLKNDGVVESVSDTAKIEDQDVKQATTQKETTKPTARSTTSKAKMPTGRNGKK